MMLQVKRINTYYGTSHVLQDISLEVKAGESVALLGRNGMGKTTTLAFHNRVDTAQEWVNPFSRGGNQQVAAVRHSACLEWATSRMIYEFFRISRVKRI